LSRPNSILHPPASNELEISIFGPGYGEAILLHIGNGEWILVDSCLEPTSKEPAALHYLAQIGVDIESAVKLIVATHWHDDHVRGLSKIVAACKSANVALSGALSVKEFLTLVAVHKNRTLPTSSSLKELAAILRILDERRARGNRAVVDRQLHLSRIPLSSGSVQARIFSVSPSDGSLQRATLEFTQLLLQSKNQPAKVITSPSPNHSAVVLWVEVGQHVMLLGADLECTADPTRGWKAVLNLSTVIAGREEKKAKVFKVAHHGANSGHEPRVWTDILLPEPIAVLTPFKNGDNSLPTASDRDRIKNLTPSSFITCAPRERAHNWGNRVVRDLVRDATRRIRNVHSGWGHVRARQNIEEPPRDVWRTELFGDAVDLDDVA
jgi:beta-lactamase superfamily II metal-dependent hydrolase